MSKRRLGGIVFAITCERLCINHPVATNCNFSIWLQIGAVVDVWQCVVSGVSCWIDSAHCNLSRGRDSQEKTVTEVVTQRYQ